MSLEDEGEKEVYVLVDELSWEFSNTEARVAMYQLWWLENALGMADKSMWTI